MFTRSIEMKAKQLLYLFLLFTVLLELHCQDYAAGEEGKQVTLQCNVNATVTDSISWQALTPIGFINVTKCYVNITFCTSIEPNYYSSVNNKNYLLKFAISRKVTAVKCIWDNISGRQYNIYAYVLPKKFTCNPPEFVNANNALSVTCNTDQVWPKPQCRLIQYTGVNTLSNPIVTYEYTNSSIQPQDYSVKCTIVSELFNVITTSTMILSVGMTVVKGATEVFTEANLTVPLFYPLAVLDNDCTSDYILSGTPATCTCKLTNPGSPPGNAFWTSPSAAKFETTLINGSSQLNVRYNPADVSPSFKCTVQSSVFLPKIEASYEPKFAFGPTEVALTAMPSADVLLANTTSIELKCNVPANQVSPGVTFNFYVSSNEQFLNNPSHYTGSFYTSSLIYSLKSTGSFDFTCKAQNRNFPTISAQQTLQVQAIGGSAKVKFTTPESIKVDRCSEITLSCDVNLTQVYPGIKNQFYINNKLYKLDDARIMVNSYRLSFQYKFSPSSNGEFVLECVVVNSHTLSELSRDSITIAVQGEPCETILAIGLGVGLGGGALLLLVLVLGIYLCKRRRTIKKKQETQAISFTVGDSKVKVIVQQSVRPNGQLTVYPEPQVDYLAPSEYCSTYYGDSMRTESTKFSDSFNCKKDEEAIYNTLEDYINDTGDK